MRAAAALCVVVFHQFQYIIPATQLGRYGVDLFFIISGFIIVALTDGRKITPAGFFLNRVIRVVPLYFIATAVTLALAVVHIYVPHLVTSNASHVFKSVIFFPDFDKENRIYPALYLGWTLNYEMFFYALFALFLIFTPSVRILFLMATLVALSAAGGLNNFQSAAALTYTDPRILEFGTGCIFGRVFGLGLKNQHPRDQVILSAIVVAALSLAALFFHALLPAVIISAIFIVVVFTERSGRITAVPVLLFLGEASYSIYLFQEIAADIVRRVILFLSHSFYVSESVACASAAIAGVVLGCIVCIAIERPVTSFLRRELKRRSGGQSSIATAAGKAATPGLLHSEPGVR